MVFLYREKLSSGNIEEIAQVGEGLQTTANLQEDYMLPPPESCIKLFAENYVR